MKTLTRIAIWTNLALAAGLAANGSFGYALFNFVAALSIEAMSDRK